MPRNPKRYRVVWTEAASRDLNGIVVFVAGRSRSAGRDLLGKLRRRVASLDRVPERGKVVPEVAYFGIRSHRETVEHPFRLSYRVTDEEVRVLAILDGRRDLATILLERLVRED